VDSPEVLREHISPGQSLPIDDTASGQVFRLMDANTPPPESSFPIYTRGVRDPFTASSAAPLITSRGVFLGVITVSGPTVRFTRDKQKAARKKLIEVVRKLATQLGGFPGVL